MGSNYQSSFNGNVKNGTNIINSNNNKRTSNSSSQNHSFFEFSSTSIHYWTTKSLNSLNRLTTKKKKLQPPTTNSSQTTVFGIEAEIPPQTCYEHREYHTFEREERYRRPSESVSEHYATLGRNSVRKPTSYSVDQYSRTSSMERRKYYDTQATVSKSETRLDGNANSLQPSTSTLISKFPPRIPGDPRITYEERYESSSEVDIWIQSQSIGKRLLDKHDRMILKNKDERDAIQKKTFTKWVNKHLSKSNRRVDDLFVDLRDGFSLISLLEALSGETLPRENGYTRFHRIQNCQYVLEFLKKKNIKVVNIRPEDIVEGNGKLTLGLIWTIILNFQVSVIKLRQQQEALARAAALSHHNNSDNKNLLFESTTSTYFASNGASAITSSSTATTSSSVVLQRQVNKIFAFNLLKYFRCGFFFIINQKQPKFAYIFG